MTVSAATLVKEKDIQARTVRDFCHAYGVGKTLVYELIGQGALVAVKAGTRTLITEESARAWFGGLTPQKPSAQSHKSPHKQSADCSEPRRKAANGNIGSRG